MRWRNFFAGVFVWAIYTVFMAWVMVIMYSYSHKPMSWGDSLFYEGSFALVAGGLSPVVVSLAKRFRLEHPHLFRNAIVHGFGTIAYGIVTRLVWELAMAGANHSQGAFTVSRLVQSVNWGMSDAAPLYWIIVAVHYASDYYRRYQGSLVNAANLNAQLARAQLQSLKMQLHPHFLFNTLHAISELIHEDPVAAEQMILGLSQLLRLSLETSSAVEVPLAQELQFTRLYLDIEKMRFDDRLQVTIEIAPDAADAMVPNLILQPLLENAVKHGISKRPGKGEIVLSAKRDRESLLITIRDNGAGLNNNSAPIHEGIGLSTTRARLLKLYGTRQSFHFISRPESGTEAVMRLPFQTESSQGENELIESSYRR